MKSDTTLPIKITCAQNGFILQQMTPYGADGQPEVFSTFEDAICVIAKTFEQRDFSETLKESQSLSRSLTNFVAASVAPKLLAIEAKVNPGVENVVNEESF